MGILYIIYMCIYIIICIWYTYIYIYRWLERTLFCGPIGPLESHFSVMGQGFVQRYTKMAIVVGIGLDWIGGGRQPAPHRSEVVKTPKLPTQSRSSLH